MKTLIEHRLISYLFLDITRNEADSGGFRQLLPQRTL